MDGCGPATAITCLFQSSIVLRSVITVYAASQQPVSCAYYPFAHKRFIEKKGGACVSSPSARVLPLSKTALLPLSSLSFSIIHKLHCSIHRMGKCLGGMATYFQNGINAWQHMCCQKICGPMALLFLVIWELLMGLAASSLLQNTWFEWVAVNTPKHINTKQCYHLLPINRARFMSCATTWSLGFPGFISVKSTTCTVQVTPISCPSPSHSSSNWQLREKDCA